MYNPFDAEATSMSDVEFEKYVQRVISLISKSEGISCDIEHNKIISTYDGDYQVDVLVTYEFLGTKNIIVVECKKYKNPVKRDQVVILNNRVKSIGANKGILFSTSRFQSGAIKYAKQHGIALIHVIKGELLYEAKSAIPIETNIPDFVDLPRYCGQHIYETETGIGITLVDDSYNRSIIEFIKS